MKLGLLAVVAVAVLLPSFSESRIVSKCELRDKLREKLKLPKRLEEGILATVICEVDRRSHLNTAVVTMFGKRIPTTPKPTAITAPATKGVNKKTAAATIQSTSTNSTTTQMTNNIAAPATTTTATTTTATSPATTNSTISSLNTALMPNSRGGGKRQKREADSSCEEKNKFNKERVVRADSQMEDEDETSGEEEPGYIFKPWSLGLYGLFQLSDKHFCDSGYRWSRNVCRTSCTAFTDDDITDDIACVIKTGYWREILGRASHSCHHASKFFNECN
ncbi:uncharacterized protein LOC115793776 [Archocentrus centrarchus]|uniref:uncharacterized protein LOC115793776 n=1 Tax=Archocentrus centrarchus TaxID=63155 RepID=UPI0011E9EFA8|nr:uncharacterized protein LOC115793776 [Archocentrus centrarchus]